MPEQRLIGIARLAANATPLEEKRSVHYRELPCHDLLSRVRSDRVPFFWAINPYRGCEYACRYCYARYTHGFMELRDPYDFENVIFAKQWNPAHLREALGRVRYGESIVIGTATDPYQPAERRFGITRAILEVLAQRPGLNISITTKSDLPPRDLDLLRRILDRSAIQVNFTITTMDAALARKIEPRAPRPDLRIEAMRRIAAAGIATGVFCAPVLPLLTDSEASLRAVARAASEVGARWLMGNPVFLRDATREVFFEFLEREFPALTARYRERYHRAVFLRGGYVEQIRARIARLKREFGLQGDGQMIPQDPQMTLFDGVREQPLR
jgi:DNA repair photolyase